MKGRQKGAWLLIKKDDEEAEIKGYDPEEHLVDIKATPKPKEIAAGKRSNTKAKSKQSQRTETLKAESTGEDVEYLICDKAAMLAYMNKLGCIQLNPFKNGVSGKARLYGHRP